MNISQAALAWLYVYALLLGVVLAGIYDLMRITRVFLGVHYSRRASKRLQEIKLPFIKPYGRRTERRALGIVVFFEDLFFCIFAAAAIIVLFYQLNNGSFRFSALIIVGLGFLIYRATVGRAVMLFSEAIAFVIEVFLRYVIFFIMLPIRFLAGKIKKMIEKAVKKADQARDRSMRRHYTEGQRRRLQHDACGLLPEEGLPEKRRPKRGKNIAKGKKAIQSDTSDQNFVGRSRRGFDRSVRQ